LSTTQFIDNDHKKRPKIDLNWVFSFGVAERSEAIHSAILEIGAR